METLPELSSAPPEKRRAPTLYLIIAVKLGKGVLLLLLALGVYSLANADFTKIYEAILKAIRADPEGEFFASLAAKVSHITPSNVYWVAGGTAFYSLFSLVEGVGLIFRVGWAGWMAIGESAFFIPIEVYDLMRGYSHTVFVILLLNILIVWYLLQNRQRLFKHH